MTSPLGVLFASLLAVVATLSCGGEAPSTKHGAGAFSAIPVAYPREEAERLLGSEYVAQRNRAKSDALLDLAQSDPNAFQLEAASAPLAEVTPMWPRRRLYLVPGRMLKVIQLTNRGELLGGYFEPGAGMNPVLARWPDGQPEPDLSS
ncbi:MAG TPA: hypothetical protein VFL83_13730 [Anaeromyxobacter sp.]|nr:hypothetical protein [Anaeromyxobacter sp.]